MSLFRPVPPFTPDSRANRLADYTVYKYRDMDRPLRWLDLRGPEEAAQQILMAAPDLCRLVPVPSERMQAYTHELEFPTGLPNEIRELAGLLTEVLSLRRNPGLDCSIALDWYKDPESSEDPMQWKNTPIGELVYRGKYYTAGTSRNQARTDLVDVFANFFRRHPLYRDGDVIVTVPGHKADGQSFGEKLAAAVAQKVDKPLVQTVCTSGPRPPAKEGGSAADATFEIPTTLHGQDVIVLDDVCRSGSSMRKAALAARQSGAARVFGLSAVRTMRS